MKRKWTFVWCILYLNEWKLFWRQYLLSLQRFFFSHFFPFCLYFFLLHQFEVIRCFVKLLMATSACFFWNATKKRKLEKCFLGPRFGYPNCYTSHPNTLSTSLLIDVGYDCRFILSESYLNFRLEAWSSKKPSFTCF